MAEQFIESSVCGELDGTTPVVIVPPPGATAPERHVVRTFTICNKDDQPVVLTITLIDNAGVNGEIVAGVTLDPGDTLVWSEDVLVLDTADKWIEAVLDGAVNATEPSFTASFAVVEN